MNFKEFFKPTKIKIILTTIILAVFIPFIKYQKIIFGGLIGYTVPTQTTSIAGYLLLEQFLLVNFIRVSYLDLIFGFVISYIISCLIYQIPEKFHKILIFISILIFIIFSVVLFVRY